MRNLLSIQISHIIAIFTAGYLIYYLLLCENCLHSSITEIINYTDHMEMMSHMIVLGLLPIYIGVLVFGAAMFGLYLGSLIQHLTFKFIKK